MAFVGPKIPAAQAKKEAGFLSYLQMFFSVSPHNKAHNQAGRCWWMSADTREIVDEKVGEKELGQIWMIHMNFFGLGSLKMHAILFPAD